MKPRSLIATPLAACLVLGPVASAWADEYVVERGDTLSGIAARYDTSWQALYRLNTDIVDDPDLIFPGQVLDVGEGRSAVRQPAASRSPGTVRPATGSITSAYGMRTHPITGVYKLHSGTDFGYGDGKAYAARSGEVAAVTYDGAYGNMVTIGHGGGVKTRYAHLASASVGVGDQVDAGDVVGRIGATGYATGAHLHFEVLKGGSFVDPMTWFD